MSKEMAEAGVGSDIKSIHQSVFERIVESKSYKKLSELLGRKGRQIVFLMMMVGGSVGGWAAYDIASRSRCEPIDVFPGLRGDISFVCRIDGDKTGFQVLAVKDNHAQFLAEGLAWINSGKYKHFTQVGMTVNPQKQDERIPFDLLFVVK